MNRTDSVKQRARAGLPAVCLCVGFGLAFPASAADPLKVGLQPFLSYAPAFIALEKGYFKQEGLDISTTMIRGGGTSTLTAELSKDVDISSGAITASMLNAIIKGVKLRIIADKGQNRKGYSTNELWISKALADSGVKNAGGLRGKSIATSGTGSADWVILGMLAEKYGLAIEKKDVIAVSMPGPERNKAVESGVLDGAVLVEPFIGAIDKSKAVRLERAIDITPVFQTAVYYVSQSFLDSHRAEVNKFLAALRRATADYMKNPKSDENVAILSKYTKVSPAIILSSTPAYFSSDLKVSREGVAKTVDFLYRHKLIGRPLKLEEFVEKGAM